MRLLGSLTQSKPSSGPVKTIKRPVAVKSSGQSGSGKIGDGPVHPHPEKAAGGGLDTWSETIWTVVVERVLVHKNGGLTVGFYNGSEIRIGA